MPDYVTRRYDHSISAYAVTKECTWIVITGGYEQYNHDDSTSTFITSPASLVLMELGIMLAFTTT